MTHETVEWLPEHERFILPALEPISSYFSIPPLNDKPQDPIVQTILSPAQSRAPLHGPPSPTASHSRVSPDASAQGFKPVSPLLWNEASLLDPQDIVSLPKVGSYSSWSNSVYMKGSFHVMGSESTYEQPKITILDRTTSRPLGFIAELVSAWQYALEAKIIEESVSSMVV